MKQYVIDELRPLDYKKIKTYLEENFGPSRMGSVFWIPVEEAYLSEIQMAHKACQPFYFAVDMEPDRIVCELLVRNQNNIRCDCIGYATQTQRDRFIRFIDAMFETLSIIA